MEILYDWTMEEMLEVELPDPDAFLKIAETLTRIGIASIRDNTLYQTANILHKKGRYFLVHFKELFALDGRNSNITLSDIERRNAIACLLEEWGLLTIVDKSMVQSRAPMTHIKVVSYKEKSEWTLVSKYTIGKKRK